MPFQTMYLLYVFALLIAMVYYPGRFKASPPSEDNNPYRFSLSESIGASYTDETLTLDEWHKATDRTIYLFNGTWVSGNEVVFISKNEEIVLFNVDSQNSKILYNISAQEGLFAYELSADGKFLLLQLNAITILASRGHDSQYKIVNIETGESNFLNSDTELLYYRKAIFAPVKHAVAFVDSGSDNVYYVEDPTKNNAVQITNDGVNGLVFNGIPSWVYDEEYLTLHKTLWFSPDGTKLAYLKIDETQVPKMHIPGYGKNVYPVVLQAGVPMAGGNNPIVSLHLVDLENEYKQYVLPSPVDLNDPMLAKVVWANNDVVNAIWMNRLQNDLYILAYDVKEPAAGTPADVVLHRFEKNGWYNLRSTNPLFSRDGSKFLFILSQEQNEIDGAFKHLVLIENEENGKVHVLTKGNFVVMEILGWIESEDLIYYLASAEEDPGSNHVYSMSFSEKKATCLSCKLNSLMSNYKCLFNRAFFSRDYSHFAIDCKGPGIPTTFVLKTSEAKPIYIWEDNEALTQKLRSMRFPDIEIYEFSIAENFKAYAKFWLPPNLDRSGKKKYPLLLNVYAAPDYQRVTKEFQQLFIQYLPANKDVITVTIDGRGSDGTGDKNLFSIYRRLGTLEVDDQFASLRLLLRKLPYIDPERIALYGGSYGGYVAGIALAKDKEGLFKCGISVAPVTDWFTQESVFTERYMGLPTPDDNIEGYKAGDLLAIAEGIRGKKYLLVYGTFDDIVCTEQAHRLSRALQVADIPFTQMAYPDGDHELTYSWLHNLREMEMFLDDCYRGE